MLDFGLRRATVTEVARRAGLSRITVYRRYRDGRELLRAVMIREFAQLLAEAEQGASGLSGHQLVIATVLATVRGLIEHPLFVRLLELEPETLLPYLTGPPGRFQTLAREHLAERIAAAQAAGEVRAGDPRLLAATIELAARGATFAAPAQPPRQREQALAELEALIGGYLRP